MNKNDWTKPYIAGFLDGEGCIGLTRYNRYGKPYFNYGIFVYISNTNCQILEWIKGQYGGYMMKIKRKKPHHKQCWNLALRHRKALKLLKDIMPFLIIKRELAEVAIRIGERCQTTYDHKRLKSMERQEQDECDYKIFKQLQTLNARGEPLPTSVE